jgi:RNA polymerase sigma-70 factor (ECF subfamily)
VEGKDDLPDQPSDDLDENDFEFKLNHVLIAIQQLPPGYKTIVQLYLIEEIPQEEIGLMLGISHGTVRSQYFRARKQIIRLVQKMKTNG